VSKDLNELIVIEPEKALTVFTTEKALEPYLKLVKAEIDKHVPDTSTKKGREAIASLAYKVAQVKSAVDKIGKDLKDEQKKIPDLIDSARNYAKETLQAWQDECRKPLTDWEIAEERRIVDIKADLAEVVDAGIRTKEEWDSLPIDAMRDRLKEVENQCMDKTYWHEFLEEAIYEQKQAIETMRGAIERRIKHDAEQLELAELRRKNAEREEADRIERVKREQEERDERLRQEAAEKARLAAEAKAEADRVAEANRIALERAAEQQKLIDADNATRKAQQEKEDAELREAQAKIDAENAVKETEARIKREQEATKQREADELARREANKKHAAKIHNEALEAFVKGGVSEDCAKQVVTLIAKKEIPHVSIAY
jgi:hypothetical protein